MSIEADTILTTSTPPPTVLTPPTQSKQYNNIKSIYNKSEKYSKNKTLLNTFIYDVTKLDKLDILKDNTHNEKFIQLIQIIFYTLLLVIVNKKNKEGDYEYKNFEDFQDKFIKKGRAVNIKELINQQDYEFLYKELDVKFLKNLGKATIRFLVDATVIGLLINSVLGEENKFHYKYVQLKEDVIIKNCGRDYNIFGYFSQYFTYRFHILCFKKESDLDIHIQYKNDYKNAKPKYDEERNNFKFMFDYLVTVFRNNDNIDLTLPIDENGSFINVGKSSSLSKDDLQKVKYSSVIKQIIPFTSFMLGMGGFILDVLKITTKLSFFIILGIVKIVFSIYEIETPNDTKKWLTQISNFTIGSPRIILTFLINKLKFDIGDISSVQSNAINEAIKNLTDNDNSDKLLFTQAVHDYLTKDTTHTTSIYIFVNQLYENLTNNKDLSNKSAEKDYYPVNFAAKLLYYYLNKYPELNNANDNTKDNYIGDFQTIFSTKDNEDNSGELSYKRKLYEQLINAINLICQNSNNGSLLTNITTEFLSLVEIVNTSTAPEKTQ